MNVQVCRSALFMPASNARALEKGPSLDTDAIIIDLEDSVSAEEKTRARGAAAQALANQDYGQTLRVLRINGMGTQWCEDDIAVITTAAPDAVLLPKVESAQDIATLSALLDRTDGSGIVKIWAMLETPKAVLASADIAAAVSAFPRLATFCIGNNDMAKGAGMPMASSREFLMPWLMQILASARANGLNILDGVYNNFKDTQGFEKECVQGAAMGMDGKAIIHPIQLAIANTAFSPSESEISEATAIVEIFAQAKNLNKGVVQLNGQMVERLHLDIAQRTLAKAKHIQPS